jgi:hypothetical protein
MADYYAAHIGRQKLRHLPTLCRRDKKDNVSRYFCSQITSAWNACPAHLLRAEIPISVSQSTLCDAFDPAGDRSAWPRLCTMCQREVLR